MDILSAKKVIGIQKEEGFADTCDKGGCAQVACKREENASLATVPQVCNQKRDAQPDPCQACPGRQSARAS